MAVTITTAREPRPGRRQAHPERTSSSRPAWVVAASLVTGLLVALLLAFLPFVPVEESALTGAVLCGFATGWTLLWRSSQRFTDQPQRWAKWPALFMGVGGGLLLALGPQVLDVLRWVWPPALVVLVVWMASRMRRELPSRGGRAQLYVVFAILAIAAVGGGYATLAEATESTSMPATGRLVDVGGHRLYLSCVGSGSPTVVLEPGAGATSAQLGWIAPDVSRSTRVCVYDRAGRGWSEPAGMTQDGARIAADLHTLLHRAGVTGPYVLAGHSFGGLYVRIFAARYPDEVAGLVLVDSTAAESPARSVVPPPGDGGVQPIGRVPVIASLASGVGLTRILGRTDFGTLPARSRDEARAAVARASWLSSTVDEYLRGGASMHEAASLRDLSDKPLVVLTAGEHPAAWMSAQHQMVALSTNGVQRIVPGATHTDLLLVEKYADATSQAVLDVVDSIRRHQPLGR
jgi:pimeloyl-ACP methyl ester carboxylesterase